MDDSSHLAKVASLQEKIKSLALQKASLVTLKDQKSDSNTTRSKSYKKNLAALDLSSFNQILHIDPQNRIAIVEPRVTMEELLKGLLPFGLTVPVIPEFKAITVGGAMMGVAAESSSHRCGCFHDCCLAFEVICGDGSLLRVSPSEHSDIFYGLAGSYGSLGILVSAEIKLIPLKKFIHLHYHSFTKPQEAIHYLMTLSKSTEPPDFLDGVIFAKNCAMVVEGHLSNECPHPDFSLKPLYAEWFFQHLEKKKSRDQECMDYQEYIFRYDLGAFWMGAYLFSLPFLTRFITQVLLNFSHKDYAPFSESEVKRFHHLPRPGWINRALFHPFVDSKRLWHLLHLSEKWVQERFVIQDFCIPEKQISLFFEQIVSETGIFPLWLCPIKGTRQPQIFAPHLLPKTTEEEMFINFGVYGIPSLHASIKEITKKLENKTKECNGRKVLYSHSYYTQREFWDIYDQEAYQSLREKTFANGMWPEITDKVLSS